MMTNAEEFAESVKYFLMDNRCVKTNLPFFSLIPKQITNRLVGNSQRGAEIQIASFSPLLILNTSGFLYYPIIETFEGKYVESTRNFLLYCQLSMGYSKYKKIYN